MALSKNVLIVATCAIASMANSAFAAPTIYYGLDAGAGSADAHPHTTTARNSFAAAATTVGSVKLPVTFEGLSVGYTSTVSVDGFVVNLFNQDTTSAGIRTTASSGNETNILGYNTTPGGSKFLEFSPVTPATASFVFNFTNPISAFGANFTGIGTQAFPVDVSFNDGKSESYVIDGATNGGALFWGFTSAGASISSLTIKETSGNNRDVFGIDDVILASSPAAVPEPAAWVMMILGMGVVGGAMRRRSKVSTQVAYAR